MLPAGLVLDLGSGSGYGTASLARSHPRVVGLDRIRPDRTSRAGAAHFVRARLEGMPFARRSFGLIVSFQVIEHLEDPSVYLDAIAGLLGPGGVVLITTPNRLMSDHVNPFHVHEYQAEELAARLRHVFRSVDLRGIGASQPVRHYLELRSQRIRRIMRLDPMHLRDRVPRPVVEWLFARFALLVRRQTQASDGTPEATWRDFPVGPADACCLDLLAICRDPVYELRSPSAPCPLRFPHALRPPPPASPFPFPLASRPPPPPSPLRLPSELRSLALLPSRACMAASKAARLSKRWGRTPSALSGSGSGIAALRSSSSASRECSACPASAPSSNRAAGSKASERMRSTLRGRPARGARSTRSTTSTGASPSSATSPTATASIAR